MNHTNDSKQVEMTYAELVAKFRSAERNGIHMTGYIQFTRDSFTEEYSEQARTYGVSSNNKAYRPNMGGYSIYGGSLDGSDPCVRLEQYMADECGGKNGCNNRLRPNRHHQSRNTRVQNGVRLHALPTASRAAYCYHACRRTPPHYADSCAASVCCRRSDQNQTE